MPKDNTYFDEASKLLHDDDVFISYISNFVYKNMLNCHLDSGLSPAFPDTFNILYFFQSVIRALLMEHPEVTLTSKSFPYPCERINAVNWPDDSGVWSRDNSGTLIRYLDLVRGDSDTSGNKFDVDYSVKIILLLLNTPDFTNMLTKFDEKIKDYSFNNDIDNFENLDVWI